MCCRRQRLHSATRAYQKALFVRAPLAGVCSYRALPLLRPSRARPTRRTRGRCTTASCASRTTSPSSRPQSTCSPPTVASRPTAASASRSPTSTPRAGCRPGVCPTPLSASCHSEAGSEEVGSEAGALVPPPSHPPPTRLPPPPAPHSHLSPLPAHAGPSQPSSTASSLSCSRRRPRRGPSTPTCRPSCATATRPPPSTTATRQARRDTQRCAETSSALERPRHLPAAPLSSRARPWAQVFCKLFPQCKGGALFTDVAAAQPHTRGGAAVSGVPLHSPSCEQGTPGGGEEDEATGTTAASESSGRAAPSPGETQHRCSTDAAQTQHRRSRGRHGDTRRTAPVHACSCEQASRRGGGLSLPRRRRWRAAAWEAVAAAVAAAAED